MPTDWVWRDGIRYSFHENGNWKKSRVTILTLDKIEFETDCNKRQGRSLYHDKGVISNEYMLFISFSCLITLARTSSTMLTSNGEVDFPEAYQFCWPFQWTIFWFHWFSLLFSLLYFINLHSNLYYIFFLLLILSLVCSSSLDVWVVNLSYLLEIFFNVATTHLYCYSGKAVSR